jgi:thiamine pyrophosphokinase
VVAQRGAIILADGEVPGRELLDAAWPGWSDGVDLVVAADGGARHATPLGLRIDVWVGDGESVDGAQLTGLEAAGAEIHRVATEKDETDTELALGLALDAGAQQLVILGGLGGPRLDHGVANVALLQSARLGGVPAVLYDPCGARISLLAAPDDLGRPVERSLEGREGDIVSLIPVGGPARGVTTTHLRYPLAHEDLELGRTRGVSNVRTAPVARVRLDSGRLLVIETPVTVGS